MLLRYLKKLCEFGGAFKNYVCHAQLIELGWYGEHLVEKLIQDQMKVCWSMNHDTVI